MTEWTRRGPYFQTKGRYTVSAARVAGQWRFTAWRMPSGKDKVNATVENRPRPQPLLLGSFDSAQEARARCEEESDE